MRVRELIEMLQRFEPEANVRLGVALPGDFIEIFERMWVADYGGGPQINAPLNFTGFRIYAGCGLQQMVHDLESVPQTRSPAPSPSPRAPEVDLGRYATEEEAAKVRDFYIVHRRLRERLTFPDFDYENWIPPRTVEGSYNEHVARILEKKLLEE
jgi:hypothetical protein